VNAGLASWKGRKKREIDRKTDCKKDLGVCFACTVLRCETVIRVRGAATNKTESHRPPYDEEGKLEAPGDFIGVGNQIHPLQG